MQIFRHACESGATAELLATLIWVLSCKTTQFTISAQRVTVLLDMEGADGRLTDTHGCSKHTLPPEAIPSARGLSSNSTGWGAVSQGPRPHVPDCGISLWTLCVLCVSHVYED